ncbi:hypothetical protein [Agromyces laixinhei]|uniref:hypothetical protein n=1 Tax=Agromyces laixinhei TaxID=2585717 RepID=UPI0012ECEC1C|nr:hypothetical protein [Agromyces laixinhei]
MRLAIADPPYLGRANRWYGDGRGSSGGRHVADHHPAARDWDVAETHRDLVRRLIDEYDGWAIAAAPDSLPVYLGACVGIAPRVMIWHRRNAPPSGSRIGSMWEPVILSIPGGRSANGTGLHVSDVLDESAPRRNFAGSKPSAWTRWVLDALGYRPDEDEVHDIFAGSGAVAAASDGMLALVGADTHVSGHESP